MPVLYVRLRAISCWVLKLSPWMQLVLANFCKSQQSCLGSSSEEHSQLMIRSYELGVLFLPSDIEEYGREFSCTANGGSSKGIVKSNSIGNSVATKTKLVTLAWQGSKTSEVIPLPCRTTPSRAVLIRRCPWSWDRRYTRKDVYGQIWPRRYVLFKRVSLDCTCGFFSQQINRAPMGIYGIYSQDFEIIPLLLVK
ncbi:tyrosyl-DNA phosphodiesterase 1-like [Hibiscus syriacus]|uniref:tyrosyl-DNA phosphodiesterase 1-like n=1 Tax=Hibiscus syriacus TaxID=106335 RepID=UPI001921FC4C|nr:tyrosyl-DNA phosphodiesterase 1-like [Hibiscus syriacus]